MDPPGAAPLPQPPHWTQVPLPTFSGGRLSEPNALLVPIYTVTHASQLPPDFLEPSPEKQLVIGFDCEGVDLCRSGALCIMQLAFPDAVYLVDAIEGGETLIQACKPALESSHVTKVIHDCKRDSEALYFQFGIKLHNVMDTQVLVAMALGKATKVYLLRPKKHIELTAPRVALRSNWELPKGVETWRPARALRPNLRLPKGDMSLTARGALRSSLRLPKCDISLTARGGVEVKPEIACRCNNGVVDRIPPIVSEDCEIRGGFATPISSLRKLGPGDVDNTIPIITSSRAAVVEPMAIVEVVPAPDIEPPTDIGRTGSSASPEKAIPAVPEEVPEAFPALDIEWPGGSTPASASGSLDFASQVVTFTEKLIDTRSLPSVETMRSWLEAQTRSYHVFGGSQDLWMAKLALIWEEFSRLHAAQRQKEQIRAMLNEETEQHQALLAAAVEARSQSQRLREESEAARQRAEELTRAATQSAVCISDLEKKM